MTTSAHLSPATAADSVPVRGARRRAARLAGRARPCRATAGRERGLRARASRRPASTCCSSGTVALSRRCTATRSRSPAPTSAASTPAPPRPTSATGSSRSTPTPCARSPTPTFFVLPADEFASAMRHLVPDGDAPAGGPVLRHAQPASHRRRARAAAGARLAVGRAHPRAEQPGRRGRTGHRGAARPGRRRCGTSSP